MEQQNTRLRNAGFATFFFSGICAISAGVVVSLLQERGQPAGGAADGHAAQCAGHEAQRAAADHRLRGGLRRHGADRRSGAAGSGLFCGGHRQGQRYQHLYHSGQRSLCRPHPGHEPDAQLLRLRRAAVPVSGCLPGCCSSRTPPSRASTAGW